MVLSPLRLASTNFISAFPENDDFPIPHLDLGRRQAAGSFALIYDQELLAGCRQPGADGNGVRKGRLAARVGAGRGKRVAELGEQGAQTFVGRDPGRERAFASTDKSSRLSTLAAASSACASAASIAATLPGKVPTGATAARRG